MEGRAAEANAPTVLTAMNEGGSSGCAAHQSCNYGAALAAEVAKLRQQLDGLQHDEGADASLSRQLTMGMTISRWMCAYLLGDLLAVPSFEFEYLLYYVICFPFLQPHEMCRCACKMLAFFSFFLLHSQHTLMGLSASEQNFFLAFKMELFSLDDVKVS